MALPSEAPAPTYALSRLREEDAAERAELFRFIRAAWGSDSWHANQERWTWQILGVPAKDPAGPPLWILTRGREIIGQVSAIPVRLSLGGQEQSAAWVSDLMILPEYWNRGGFPLLVREMARAYPVALVLGMNEKADGLFQRSPGWMDLGVIPRFERYCSWRSIASVRTVVALVRQVRHAVRSLVPANPPAGLVVRPVARFDDRVSALWDRVIGGRIGVRRDARWLNWKYAEQPLLTHERLEVVHDETLVGCAVLRIETFDGERHGYLVECFAEVAWLVGVVGAAVAHLRAQGVDRITCEVLDPPTEAALEQLGFVRRRSGMKFMVRAAGAALGPLVGDRTRWYITRGDADQDRPR